MPAGRATVSSICAPIVVSITIVAGSISGVAIDCHALRGIAFLEACGDHLCAIDGIESTASSSPSPIALSLMIVLVSRIVFEVIVSLASVTSLFQLNLINVM